MVAKVICEFTDGSFGRNTACRDAKSVLKVNIYSNKNKKKSFSVMKV